MDTFHRFLKVLSGPIKFFWRVTAEGSENIPEGSCILVCNHTAIADVLILEVSSPRQIKFMAKKELFKVPIIGKLLPSVGAYPVDRGGVNVSSIKTTLSLLEHGSLVGIFPQGTRQPYVNPEDTPLKNGAGLIAHRSGACILPAYVYNKKNKIRLFHKNHVIFGKPILLSDIPLGEDTASTDEFRIITEYAFREVCALREKGEKYYAENR